MNPEQLEKDMKKLIEIGQRYGWVLFIPDGADGDEVMGVILGTPDYISFLLGGDPSEVKH